MALLEDLTDKTRVQCDVDNMGNLQEVKGQDLSTYELEMRNAACDVVRRYFEGKLRLDVFEKGSTNDNPLITGKKGRPIS